MREKKKKKKEIYPCMRCVTPPLTPWKNPKASPSQVLVLLANMPSNEHIWLEFFRKNCKLGKAHAWLNVNWMKNAWQLKKISEFLTKNKSDGSLIE